MLSREDLENQNRDLIAEVERLRAIEHDYDEPQVSELIAENTRFTYEIEQLRAALLFLGKAFELEDDQTDSGFTYREALAQHPAQQPDSDARDAARWRAFVRVTGHETDLSSGPGVPKDMHIWLNCSGCARYRESGALDWKATLEAVMDEEIKFQAAPEPIAAESASSAGEGK